MSPSGYAIRDFVIPHAKRAQQIALRNYNAERAYVPSLPAIDAVPDLIPFAENGFGVAAFDGDEMVGFLCSISPFNNAFHSTNAVGIFSPMGGNGAIGEKRAEIYALMYQAAAEKWARAGASSHAVCLYAHDKEAQEQFFRYGFGLRCIDAIRGMDGIGTQSRSGAHFVEITPDRLSEVLPLIHLLDAHMVASPTFMQYPSYTESSFSEKTTMLQARYFVAETDGRIVALITAVRDGETFICDTPGYLHLRWTFCLPEYRGKGIAQNLLVFLLHTLREEGFTRIGVDFESINPAAHNFWLRYFDAYTHSVVRRIDNTSLPECCGRCT